MHAGGVGMFGTQGVVDTGMHVYAIPIHTKSFHTTYMHIAVLTRLVLKYLGLQEYINAYVYIYVYVYVYKCKVQYEII